MEQGAEPDRAVGHQHLHVPVVQERLRLALVLTVGIFVVEAAAGLASHSLALLSDAGHILTDVFALAVAWFAVAQAGKPADSRRTYGYHRVGMLAAVANAGILIILVAGIAFEAIRRLPHPQPVQGGIVIIAAGVAIAVNLYIGLSLRGAGQDLNVRAATLHVLGDLAASVGVVLAGVLIVVTGWLYIDPLLSLAIAVLIALSATRIVIDAVNVLLEATPKGLHLEEIRDAIATSGGIISVHDLHVWSLAPERVALSCHVVVEADQGVSDAEHLVRQVEEQICRRFGIGHTTIQIEGGHPCQLDEEQVPGGHNHPHSHMWSGWVHRHGHEH